MADTKLVVDCSTGAVVEFELTPEEIAEREAMAVQFEAERVAKDAAAAEVAAAKESANAKLKALGLSDAEIAALSK
jgi:hypothetical protein